MKKYDTILFDLDGTLLDTLDDMADCVNYAMDKHGFAPCARQDVRSYVGNGVRRLIELALPEGPDTPNFEETLDTYCTYYAANCQNKTKPYAGIMELLAQLAEQGYKMGIVSNKPDPSVKELNEAWFGEYIDVAIGESPTIQKKPAPDTVLMGMKELGSDLSRTVYVGDSEVDIQTAKNAGMDIISVTWGFRDRDDLQAQGAQVLVDSPAEILAQLEVR